LELAAIKAMIGVMPWKTARAGDHQYVMAHWSMETAKFVRVMREYIAQHGYEAAFHGYKYRYVDIDEFKYWMMPVGYYAIGKGAPDSYPAVLNRTWLTRRQDAL
jgi:hypothetical protein